MTFGVEVSDWRRYERRRQRWKRRQRNDVLRICVREPKRRIRRPRLLTNQAADVGHLVPLMEQAQRNCGRKPRQMSADSGYWSEANSAWCSEQGIDAYIATGRRKHGEKVPQVRGRPPSDLDAKGRMRRKLRTKKGRATYSRRKAIGEPVFGQTKEARGLRGFVLRGVDKARVEWSLWNTTHNLLKLVRAQLA